MRDQGPPISQLGFKVTRICPRQLLEQAGHPQLGSAQLTTVLLCLFMPVATGLAAAQRPGRSWPRRGVGRSPVGFAHSRHLRIIVEGRESAGVVGGPGPGTARPVAGLCCGPGPRHCRCRQCRARRPGVGKYRVVDSGTAPGPGGEVGSPSCLPSRGLASASQRPVPSYDVDTSLSVSKTNGITI